ncbi:MAG TPA: S41 family peptidase [Candidatus Eisenbacteria bacterium]|nr:S41 family peptidase [Candidatus Eisenbacteria bacterium]
MLAGAARPSSAATPATPAARLETLAEVARLLRTEYVRDSVGAACASALEAAAAAGRFRAPEGDAAFARAVTEWLRECARDEHLELTPPPVEQTSAAATAAPVRDWVADLRARNFDVPQVRRLAGNVGYLELTSFPPPDIAGETVAHAMGLLENTDALIVDLRRNSGGAGDMVRFLATWFFDQPTAILSTYRRTDGRATEDRTLPWVPGRRRARTPLFILTSRGTFSAAEAFAFGLQQLKRAVVVGERTRGGANAGRYRDAKNGFREFIPVANGRSPVNGRTWDGVGVMPDVPVSAESALAVAHEAALAALVDSISGDSARARSLRWTLEGARAMRNRLATPSATCATLVGAYEGERRVECRAGRLWYSRDGAPERPLQPIGGGRYILDGVESSLFRFEGEGRARTVTVISAEGGENRFGLLTGTKSPR